MNNDFREISSFYHPAYIWLWESKITKEGIRQQIDEMYEMGVRAFYILGLPKEFTPDSRKTYLSPDYLSEEYIDLVYYAYCVAEEKGMYTWLYNEGGYPSGMVCGRIRKEYPELAQKMVGTEKIDWPAGTEYVLPKGYLAAFAGTKRINNGTLFEVETEVTQYFMVDADGFRFNRSDNAERKNVELFLELTHEAFKTKFGEHMGKEVTMMFDDEAGMGRWTRNLESVFIDCYGYDLCDYLPYVLEELEPETEEQYRAKSDYSMLCGELLCENYFSPMRVWLNNHNMLSVGHLDKDNCADGPYIKRYGNMMKMLRLFDVPGIDVIWNQITYPKNGTCCHEGNSFFPRLASSAARQQGHSTCLSESFGVYGAQVTPEDLRFVVNFQAVRGISFYNFASISYDRKGVVSFQLRPNFIRENPGADCLSQINNYTARLSYILQESKADIHTALYYPQRTICAGGKAGAEACRAFDELGHMLEAKGIDFDIIDEELVTRSNIVNGVLEDVFVSYKNVFVPEAVFEPEEVIEKLESTGKVYEPCIGRTNKDIMARKLLFKDGSEGFFICNTSDEIIEEIITIYSHKQPCMVDLYSGELHELECEREGNVIRVPLKLHRGESIMIWLTNIPQKVEARPKLEWVADIMDFTSFVSRRYQIHPELGPQNFYYESGDMRSGLYEWPKDFSGEVTYITKLGEVPEGQLILDLGEVRHIAKIYLNGVKISEATMPPYRVSLSGVKKGDELKIVVANTIANVCHNAKFFDINDPLDVGEYHEIMIKYEALAPAGGLLGSVRLFRVKGD